MLAGIVFLATFARPPFLHAPLASPSRGMTLSAESASHPTEEGLRRRLVPRQIAMMAMGSAIGVGLFLGQHRHHRPRRSRA